MATRASIDVAWDPSDAQMAHLYALSDDIRRKEEALRALYRKRAGSGVV